MLDQKNSVVVMPTAHRPEILAHALQKLSAASNLPEVHIYLDHLGPLTNQRLEEVEWVRDTYLPDAYLFQAKEHIQVSSGTWNILHSIKGGYDTGAEFVFLVEEDVMMKPDFMARHAALLGENNGEILASCGRRVPSFFKRYGDLYTNPGSCLTRPLLKNLMPHLNDRYFQNTGGYITETFHHPPYNSSLDDGLIRMVVREMGGRCAYPEEPICAHQGFDYYDEIDIYSNRGTLQEKIAGFERITSRIKPGDRYARDFEHF